MLAITYEKKNRGKLQREYNYIENIQREKYN